MILAFRARVYADGGVFEAPGCLAAQLEELRKDQLLSSASFLVTPNAVEENKLFAIVPSSGAGDLDVVRATTATLVNSAGLIEPAPYNLLQRSQEFENAAWTKSNATITSNAIAAPDGTLTADKLVGSATTSTHIAIQTVPFPVNTVATYSIYAKAGELNFLYLGGLGRTPNANEGYVFFNLSSGTVGANDPGYSGTISSAGDGWYKLTVSAPLTTSSLSREFRIGVTNTNGLQSYTGNGIDGVYIWGAQLVTGTSAKEYFPTTDRLDVPRLDYTNSSCPSILVEPQRTNLATYSEDFSNAIWIKLNTTVTSNTTNSPSGNLTADTFAGDGVNGFHLLNFNGSCASGVNTISIFAKKNTNNFIQLIGASTAFGTNVWANFDLNNGVVGSVGSSTTAKIENYGNGWYRCTITGTATLVTSPSFNIGLITSATSARAESNTLSTSVYIWGAQLEAGDNATSYIPTIASTVTRNADVISKTGISSLIGQTEGTIFADINIETLLLARSFISVQDSSYASNAFRIESNTLNQWRLQIRSLSSTILDQIITTPVFSNGNYKVAFAYSTATNGVAFYVNGNLLFQTTVASIPNLCNSIFIGTRLTSGFNDLFVSDSFNSAILFKTRLTNEQLELLTGSSFYTYDEMALALNYNIQ